MSLESPLSSVPPLDSNEQTKLPSIESQWYKPDIGPRLKPVTKAVYENWSDLTGDELTRHLHNIVGSDLPLTFSSNLHLFNTLARQGMATYQVSLHWRMDLSSTEHINNERLA